MCTKEHIFYTLKEQILKEKDTHCAAVVSILHSALDSVTAARWLSHPKYKIFTALREVVS